MLAFSPVALPRVAVIGSGIGGLAAAHALRGKARVTLFEAQARFGGHAHTAQLTLDGITHGVDTGFLVFNERTYPGLIKLFGQLGVETSASDMSFSVQVPRAFGAKGLEWSGTNLAGVFCQKANFSRPRFWRMLRDLLRFNALATARVAGPMDNTQSLADFLAEHRFSPEFRDWYLLPMVGCIWSCPVPEMMRFPVATLLRFCHNHGLLQIADRPQWFTVTGGSSHYVDRIVAGLEDARASTPVLRVWREGSGGAQVATAKGVERFDRVIFATHPGQALTLLGDADSQERGVLGAIRYQSNRAVLHTDEAVLPRHRSAWAAWNYEGGGERGEPRVCLHYLINRLQPLPWKRPVIVSLNPIRAIRPETVAAEYDYEHPVFTQRAIEAQQRLPSLQGRADTWYCGAWTGYGFHEDGLASGQAAAADVIASIGRPTLERAAA